MTIEHRPVPAQAWERCIRSALDGEPRYLLELLINPCCEDSQGNPISFYALPDDVDLRVRIVRCLMLGPWRGAKSVRELCMKTGWGKGKPKVADVWIDWAAASLAMTSMSLEEAREAMGIEIDLETLKRRIKERDKHHAARRASTAPPAKQGFSTPANTRAKRKP